MSEASKVDEKRIPRTFLFPFFIGMLLCSPVSSILVPNQMPSDFFYSVGDLKIRKNSQQCFPEGRPGMSDVSLLSGISGLSFDFTLLSPLLFFCLVLLPFLSYRFLPAGAFF